jgi:hypothetical protein
VGCSGREKEILIWTWAVMRQRLERTGYWSPSKAKDFSGILGMKEGDLGKGDSKGVMFMAALIQTDKPKNRSKTPNKK